MPLVVRSCRNAAEAARVRRFLDREFVVSRQRPPRLARRFPRAFAAGMHANLVFAALDGRIAGALVMRLFDWSWKGRRERGAMLGAVSTAPGLRGRGVATEVLGFARRRAAARGASFAVLWTAQPQVYRASGWRSRDQALRGDWITGSTAARLRPGKRIDIATARRLQRMRSALQPDGVLRSARDFTAIPMPATRVEAFFHGGSYALAGRRTGEGFVYEMAGPEASFDGLIERLQSAFRRVTVNCAADGAVQRAFERRARIAWRPQRLAMWLPLTRRRPPFSRWYVEYLDRI